MSYDRMFETKKKTKNRRLQKRVLEAPIRKEPRVMSNSYFFTKIDETIIINY